MNDVPQRPRAEAHVRVAALALFLLGIVQVGVSMLAFLIPMLIFFVDAIDRGLRLSREEQGVSLMFACFALPTVLLGIITTLGGYRMRQHRSYGLVTFAAIAALVPVTPCFLAGMPVGIWVMFLLWQPEVEALFKRENLPPPEWDEEEQWGIRKSAP